MSILEVVLLAAGAVIFLISFCIPVREEKLKEETRNLAAEEVKSLVSEELETVRGRLAELSEEEVKDRMAKSERTMERISNEKIMAVNEYSDTVLEEIHKNHEEVVFLYDMLKNKRESLSEAFGKTEQNLQGLLQQVKDSEITVREKLAEIAEKAAEITESTAEFEEMKAGLLSDLEKERKKTESAAGNKKQTERAKVQQKKETPAAGQEVLSDNEFKAFTPEKAEAAPRKRAPRRVLRNPKPEESAPAEERDVMLVLSDTMESGGTGNNSNIRILRLHEAGKSNTAIARELGLGIGEVQLVIDLYEGFK